jgi:hypothetical protein
MDNQTEYQKPQIEQDELQSNDKPHLRVGQRVRHNARAEQDGQHHTDKSQIDELLKSFEFSPLRFDRFILKNWYLFFIGVYAILFILLALLAWHTNGKPRNYLNCTISTHLNCVNSVSDLLAWNNILLIVAIALAALVFNHWQREIAPTFQKLLDKQCISLPEEKLNTAYWQFLSAYQSLLGSSKRYVFYVLALIITLFYVLPEFVGPLQSAFALKDPLLWFIFVSVQLLAALALLGLAYSFGVGAWTIIITAWYVRKMTKSFDFVIIPNHPDMCGGLKFLGNFCLGMAFPILICGTLLGIYSIEAYFSKNIKFYSVISSVGLVLLVLPLAFMVLYSTLWDIHLKMVNEAKKAEENFTLLISELKSEMQSSLKEHEWEDAKSVKEKIDLVQVVNPDDMKYPTWPFDRSILLKFWTPQIVPILGLFLNFTAPVADALKALITILSGNH